MVRDGVIKKLIIKKFKSNIMNTKKNYIVLITLLLITCTVKSQTFLEHLELAAGVDLMNVEFKTLSIFEEDIPTDNINDTKFLTKAANINDGFDTKETGFYIGLIYADLVIAEKLEIQPEIRFVGVKNFNQLQMPILLKYEVLEKLKLQSGPNLGFLLDKQEGVKSLNLALDFGVSYAILSDLLLEARYNWGQTNLLEQGDSDYYLKLNSFQIGLVYKLKSGNKK